MDRSEVVRCALQGAAKVAFSAALVGCGGIVIEDRSQLANGAGGASASTSEVDGTSVVAASSTTGSTTSTVSSTSTGGEGGALACEVGSGPPYTDEAILCCNKLVEDTFPTGTPTPFPPAPASAALVACCDVALEARDHGAVDGPTPVPWDSGYACCSIPGVEQPKPFSATCSPWGPPSPPAMPADLVWLEEAA